MFILYHYIFYLLDLLINWIPNQLLYRIRINNKNIIKHSTWKKLSGTGKLSTKRKMTTKTETKKSKISWLSLLRSSRSTIKIYTNLFRPSALDKYLNINQIRPTLKHTAKHMLNNSYSHMSMINPSQNFWTITK